MKLALQTIALAALFAWLPHPTATQAQDHSADAQAFKEKQRRLNIAGWTLIGAGAAFPLIAVPIQEARSRDRSDCDLVACLDNIAAVTSLVLGPAMIVTGGALLLKRRGLRKEHEAQPEVAITPGVTGLTISGRF